MPSPDAPAVAATTRTTGTTTGTTTTTTTTTTGTTTVISADALRRQLGRRGHLKGRQPDDAARAELLALLPQLAGAERPAADLLIEHLHVLNDHFGALFQRHLVALAAMLRLPMAQVSEVASCTTIEAVM